MLIASCATQPGPDSYDPPGFLLGAVHGFTSLIALVGELFSNLRVYAFPNAGGLYGLGYLLGTYCFWTVFGPVKARFVLVNER